MKISKGSLDSVGLTALSWLAAARRPRFPMGLLTPSQGFIPLPVRLNETGLEAWVGDGLIVTIQEN